MAASGIGFAAVVSFWPLLVIAVVGTLNPSAGDVSVFLPTEQAYVAGESRLPTGPGCSPCTTWRRSSRAPWARSGRAPPRRRRDRPRSLLDRAPEELWVEETWGVVKIKLADTTVIDGGGRWRQVRTKPGVECAVGNRHQPGRPDRATTAGQVQAQGTIGRRPPGAPRRG
jgi:hypothetical protein